MSDVPQAVIDESRKDIDEWAAESRLLLLAEEGTQFAAEHIADLVAALGHAGAGRALVDAGYIAGQFADWLSRKEGQDLSAQELVALLGMAGLVLADREAGQ